MTASRAHWRNLVVGVLALMALALVAPRYMPGPLIQENRALAGKPRWTGDLEAFRAATDAYVADRFPARRHLIAGLNRLRMTVGVSGSPKVIVGRDGWLFYDDGSHLGGARADPPWGREHTRQWLATLAGRTEALRRRGVAYVVFVAPLKETVYPQFGPWWFGGLAPDHPAARMPPLVAAAASGVLISPSRALDAARAAGDPVYSRHDTHWTGYGAYVGYAALMDRLHAMGLTEGPRPRSDFALAPPLPLRSTPRDLAKMLGVADYVTIRYPELYDRADLKRAKVTWLTGVKHWSKPHIIDTGAAGKPVLLMTVDSFSNELVPFLYRHFSRIIVAHNEEGNWREDLIARYQPDIVILEIVEGGLKFSMSGGGPAPSAAALGRIDAVLPFSATDLPALRPITKRDRSGAAGARRAERCNVDRIELRPQPGGRWVLAVNGWHAGGDVHGFVRLAAPAGAFSAPIDFSLPRADVAQALNAPEKAASGFDQAFVIERPPAGVYALSLYRRGPGVAGWVECAASQSVTIPASSP